MPDVSHRLFQIVSLCLFAAVTSTDLKYHDGHLNLHRFLNGNLNAKKVATVRRHHSGEFVEDGIAAKKAATMRPTPSKPFTVNQGVLKQRTLQDSDSSTEVVTLGDGIPSDPFSAEIGDITLMEFLRGADATSVTCTTEGDNGDVDIFLSWDSFPDPSDFDLSGQRGGSNENVSFPAPLGSSDLFIILYAFEAYSNVVVTCASSSRDILNLEDGIPSDPIRSATGDTTLFGFTPSADATSVTCKTEGDNGDLDIFLSWESFPDPTSFVHSGQLPDSNEIVSFPVPPGSSDLFMILYAFAAYSNVLVTCTSSSEDILDLEDGIPSDPIRSATDRTSYDHSGQLPDSNEIVSFPVPPGSSDLFIILHAFEAFSNVIVTCTSSAGDFFSLEDGIPTDPIRSAAGEITLFGFTPSADATSVICTTLGDNGDPDIYLSWDSLPDPSDFDHSGQLSGSNEIVSFPVPTGSTDLFLMLYAFEAYSDVVVTCRSTENILNLEDGIPSDPIRSAIGEITLFGFTPSEDATSLRCTTVGDNGDPDIYLSWESFPDLTSFDHSGQLNGSNEIVSFPVPTGNSNLFIILHAFEAYSNVVVTCTSSIENILNLENGVPSDPISSAIGEIILFGFTPSADAASVTCTTEGDNGDLDIFLAWESLPANLSQFQHSGQLSGSNEVLSFPVPPGSSNLFITVHAFGAYTNAIVTCTSSTDSALPSTVSLPLNTLFELSLPSGEARIYELTASTVSNIVCYTNGPEGGDLDMFTTSDLATLIPDFSSSGPNSEEVLEISPVVPGQTFYLTVTALVDTTDAFIECIDSLLTIQRANQIPVPGTKQGQSQYFKLPFNPSTSTSVTTYTNCEIVGPIGDADIYIKWGGFPAAGQYFDSSGVCFSSDDVASVPNQLPGGEIIMEDLYIQVFAFKDFSDAILDCTESSVPKQTDPFKYATNAVLADGEASSSFGLESCRGIIFSVTPDRSGNITCTLAGVDGDADIFLFWDLEASSLAVEDIADAVNKTQTKDSNAMITIPVEGETLTTLVVADQGSTALRFRCKSEGPSTVPISVPTATTPAPTSAPTTTNLVLAPTSTTNSASFSTKIHALILLGAFVMFVTYS